MGGGLWFTKYDLFVFMNYKLLSVIWDTDCRGGGGGDSNTLGLMLLESDISFVTKPPFGKSILITSLKKHSSRPFSLSSVTTAKNINHQ